MNVAEFVPIVFALLLLLVSRPADWVCDGTGPHVAVVAIVLRLLSYSLVGGATGTAQGKTDKRIVITLYFYPLISR
jgi:hypothetical protein